MKCSKEIFETRAAAKHAAAGHQKVKNSKENWREYLCRKCFKWHLTSGKKKTLRGAPRKANNKQLQDFKQNLRSLGRK